MIGPFWGGTSCDRRVLIALQVVFPTAAVVPAIMVGGTDSKHFVSLSDNVYRFCPTWMVKTDIPRFHVTFGVACCVWTWIVLHTTRCVSWALGCVCVRTNV